MSPVEFRNEIEELHSCANVLRIKCQTDIGELLNTENEPPVLLEPLAELLSGICEIERRLLWLVSQ